MSFVVAALVVGLAAQVVVRRARQALWVPLLLVASFATTVVVVHALGIVGLMVNLRLPLSAAVSADLPFLPGDLVKDVVAGRGRGRRAPRLLGRAPAPARVIPS